MTLFKTRPVTLFDRLAVAASLENAKAYARTEDKWAFARDTLVEVGIAPNGARIDALESAFEAILADAKLPLYPGLYAVRVARPDGSIVDCFHYRGTPAAAVRRGAAEADAFGVPVTHVWAEFVA